MKFTTRHSFLLITAIAVTAFAQPCYAFTVLVWGDSLSSAYRIPVYHGWVSLLSDQLKDSDISIVNGSIPGEITYGGAERISQALAAHNPDLVILALGSNDGLQGKDLGQMYENLSITIQKTRNSGAEILLLGMRIPPNYGKVYAEQFQHTFSKLAEHFETGFVPFFLEPVALDFTLMQDDGLHPTAMAQPILLNHIWPAIRPFLP